MKFNCSDSNSKLIQRMENAVKDGRVSHAYIFEGPPTSNKVDFAKAFVKGVLCPDNRGENCGRCSICDKVDHDNHEDITCIFREGKSLKDAAVASVQDKLCVKPLGERNVVIIGDADTMTARAQNRLLKTLEEPPGNSLLILLSENMENLAQTILSRCVKYRMEGDAASERNAKAEKIVTMSFEGKPFYSIINECDDCIKTREKADQLLDSMEQIYRSFLTEKEKGVPLYTFDDIYRNIREIEKSRKMIFQGMSTGYALKNLFLQITD